MHDHPVEGGTPPNWHQIEFATLDNGTEVLWGEALGGARYRILSIPVFLFGISRGVIVEAAPAEGTRLKFVRVLADSAGATICCYVPEPENASELYLTRMVPDAREHGLGFGPATFLDPGVVAIHVADREGWPAVASYLDRLAGENRIDFWDLVDPVVSPLPEEELEVAPWTLEHPLPQGEISTVRR